jgi:hypothetical protein
MSFTDGKRRIATAKDVGNSWGGRKDGFHCALCGGPFKVGDGFRFQYMGGRSFTHEGKKYAPLNFLVCDGCDGDDAADRWVALNAEYYSPKFKALRGHD